MRQVPSVQGSSAGDGRHACSAGRAKYIQLYYSILKLILYADNLDTVRERSGCSSRSLLPRGTQLGLGLVEDLPKRGHDRLGTRTLPQLDGYTCCLGSEHARRDLLRLGTSPALSRRAGSLLQLVALEPALSGLSSQFGLFVRVGDPS